jgi:hypothetical protein
MTDESPEGVSPACADAPSDLRTRVDSLERAVHSLGGAVIGPTGHDSGAFFHKWWTALRAKSAS